MTKQEFSLDFHGRNLKIETGEIAKQAGGSVLVRYNDTVVLSCATANHEPKDTDFFPLTVSYEEKLYSVGKIPGGFLRREGRPSEHATLTARLIDRPIRPLFAEGFRNEVQVVNTVLSVDPDCSSEMAAMFGASLSLCISDIPFNGPIAGVIVGRVDGEFVINPTVEQMERSDISLTVAGTKDAINMVEAGAKEVSEEDMLQALMFGHENIKVLCAFQEEIIAKCAKEKMEVSLYEIDPAIKQLVDENGKKDIEEAVSIKGKLERYGKIDELIAKMCDMVSALEYPNEKAHDKAVSQCREYCVSIEAQEVRRLISVDKIRPDGRKLDEIRPLNSQVDLLPRVHGSALFTRGETQVLSVTTLGMMSEEQTLDGIDTEETKRYMHQYNFPSYSVGEAKPSRGPGRREIGHGALAEKALVPVLPSKEEFPYAIRVVSEVLSSNGSTSQASICGSTLSLMAAGVPIKRPVAGISTGLVTNPEDENDYVMLTDIQGLEDFFGDMDFKVGGTEKGITAIQVDIKVDGLSYDIIKEAFERTRIARKHILEDVMMPVINKPRAEISKYAPRIVSTQIKVDKIKDVIGPGGKMINKIIDETGVKIDIEEDGQVFIYSSDSQKAEQALEMIEDIVREVEVGGIYYGTVTRTATFGAFIDLGCGGKEGLLHISKISKERIKNVEDVLKVGDKVTVKVTEIDDQGRINLTTIGIED